MIKDILSFYTPVVLAAVGALLAVNWIYFKVLRIAKDKGIVDNPDFRKLQQEPVPILGGIAVFFGVVTGVLAGFSCSSLFSGPALSVLGPVLCAMVIMVYVGAIDDVNGLSPRSRIVIEILTLLGLIYAGGGCVDSFHGLWGITAFSWWLGVPLTVFAGVGIINAVNMIDGVNGLSSGLCITYCLMFGFVFCLMDDLPNAILAFAMATALLPFLVHNVFGRRSRMLIGDAGTMMMGILMAWFTICVLRSDSPFSRIAEPRQISLIAMTLAILSVPVFDTLRVMGRRIMQGKSPFMPDKNHLHHLFIRLGVSHSITSLTEILLDILIVGVWAVSVLLHASLAWQLYLVVIASVVLVWGTARLFGAPEERQSRFVRRVAEFSPKTHLADAVWWRRFQRWLDAPEKHYTDHN